MHFEDIWNESEEIGSKDLFILQNTIDNIKNNLDKMLTDISPEDKAIIIGEILFDICKLTYRFNINSAAGLIHVSKYKKLLFEKFNNKNS